MPDFIYGALINQFVYMNGLKYPILSTDGQYTLDMLVNEDVGILSRNQAYDVFGVLFKNAKKLDIAYEDFTINSGNHEAVALAILDAYDPNTGNIDADKIKGTKEKQTKKDEQIEEIKKKEKEEEMKKKESEQKIIDEMSKSKDKKILDDIYAERQRVLDEETGMVGGIDPHMAKGFVLADVQEIYESKKYVGYQPSPGLEMLKTVLKIIIVGLLGVAGYQIYNSVQNSEQEEIEAQKKKQIENEKKLIEKEAEIKKIELEQKN